MSDTEKRGAVMERYRIRFLGCDYPDYEALADRIVELEAAADRAERILAALREPSEALLDEMTETWIATSWGENLWQAVLRAAVKAAEQEVG